MKTYAEKLRDPRWQKKRLEVMELDEWKCQRCASGGQTLNVHHVIYKKATDPWDYPNHLLVTLCEECHKNAEDERLKEWCGIIRVSQINGAVLMSALKCLMNASRDSRSVGMDVGEPESFGEAFRQATALLVESGKVAAELAAHYENLGK